MKGIDVNNLPNTGLNPNGSGAEPANGAGYSALQSTIITPVVQEELGRLDEGLTLGADQNLHRAMNQGAGEQFFSFLNQAVVGEIIGGTIEGTGYLAEAMNAADIARGTEQEWGNWFSQLGKDLRTWTKEATPIYEKAPGTFNPTDSGWWFNNGASVASTISLLVPAIGTVRGLSALGKMAKINQALGLNMGKTAQWVGTGISQAVVSRHMENMMEGAQVFEQTYEDRLRRGWTEEEARKDAGKAAGSVYKTDWAMLLQDIPQYMMLGRLSGGNKLTGKLANAQRKAAAGLSDDAAKVALRNVVSPAERAVTIGRRMGDFVSEGFEEAYQHIVAEEARYLTDLKSGLVERSTIAERMKNYMEEGQLWTAAFFGALGAGAFQLAGPAVKKGFDAAFRKQEVEQMSKWEKARMEEIENRNTAITKATKELLAAEQLEDPTLQATTRTNASIEIGINAAMTGNTQNAIDHLNALLQDENTSEESKKVLPEIITDVKRIGDLYEKNQKQYGKGTGSYAIRRFQLEKLAEQSSKLRGASSAEIATAGVAAGLNAAETVALNHTMGLNAINDAIEATKFILKQKDTIGKTTLESNKKRLKALRERKKELQKEAKEFGDSLTPEQRQAIAAKTNPLAKSLGNAVKEISAVHQNEAAVNQITEELNKITQEYGSKEAQQQRQTASDNLQAVTQLLESEIELSPETEENAQELADSIADTRELAPIKQEANERIRRARERTAAFAQARKDDNTGRLAASLDAIQNRSKANKEIELEQYMQRLRAPLIQKRLDVAAAIDALPTFEEISPLTEVKYSGMLGYIEREGDKFVFIPKDNPNKIYELEVTADQKPFEGQVFVVEQYNILDEIEITTEGNFVINGKEYYNAFNNPLGAITTDSEGNVVHVMLQDARTGANVHFRTPQLTESLAYLIHLQQLDNIDTSPYQAGDRVSHFSVASVVEGEVTTQQVVDAIIKENQENNVHVHVRKVQGMQGRQTIVTLRLSLPRTIKGTNEGTITREMPTTITVLLNPKEDAFERIRASAEQRKFTESEEQAAREEATREAQNPATEQERNEEAALQQQAERKAAAVEELQQTEEQVNALEQGEDKDEVATEEIVGFVQRTEGVPKWYINPYEHYKVQESGIPGISDGNRAYWIQNTKLNLAAGLPVNEDDDKPYVQVLKADVKNIEEITPTLPYFEGQMLLGIETEEMYSIFDDVSGTLVGQGTTKEEALADMPQTEQEQLLDKNTIIQNTWQYGAAPSWIGSKEINTSREPNTSPRVIDVTTERQVKARKEAGLEIEYESGPLTDQEQATLDAGTQLQEPGEMPVEYQDGPFATEEEVNEGTMYEGKEYDTSLPELNQEVPTQASAAGETTPVAGEQTFDELMAKDRKVGARKSVLYELQNELAGVKNPTRETEAANLATALESWAGENNTDRVDNIRRITFDPDESSFVFNHKGKDFLATYSDNSLGKKRWELYQQREDANDFYSVSNAEMKNINQKYGGVREMLVNIINQEAVEDIERLLDVKYSEQDKSGVIIPLINEKSKVQMELQAKWGVRGLRDFLDIYYQRLKDRYLQPASKPVVTATPEVAEGKIIHTSGPRWQLQDHITVDENGKPVRMADPDDNIDYDYLHDPATLSMFSDPANPATFTVELGRNAWWDRNKERYSSNPWVAQPMYVIHNGRRIGKLESAKKDDTRWRQDIYTRLQNQEQVTMEHLPYEGGNARFGKSLGKANNMRNQGKVVEFGEKVAKGTPHFNPINSLIGGYVRKADNTYTKDDKAPVHTSIVSPVYVEGKLIGAKLHTEFLPDDVAADVKAVQVPISEIGQVYSIKMHPSGVYHALKASTADLTPQAIDKVIKILKEGDINDVEHIVGSTMAVENIENDPKMFITGTSKQGNFFVFADPDGTFDGKSKRNTFLVDLEAFRKNPNNTVVRYAMISKNGNMAVRRENDLPVEVNINAEELLRKFLRTKKFSVLRNRSANPKASYKSPLTERTYPTYLDYLSANNVAGLQRPILATDVYNDNGTFWHDVQIQMRPVNDKARPVANEAERAEVTQQKAEPDKTKSLDSLLDGLTGTAFKIDPYSKNQINLKEASKWLTDRGFVFDESQIRTKRQINEMLGIVGKLHDSEIHGFFSNLIYLWKNAEEGTQYHEAFHEVYRTFLTEEEMVALQKEAVTRYNEPTMDELKFLQEGVNGELTLEQATALYYEEKMADEFKAWVKGVKPTRIAKNPITRFFQRIWQFIQNYFDNRPLIDRLFTRIEQGAFKYKNKVREITREEYPAQSRKGLSPEIQRQIVNSINTRFINLTDAKRKKGRDYNVNSEYRKVQIAFMDRVFSRADGSYLSAEKAAEFMDGLQKIRENGGSREDLVALQEKYKITGQHTDADTKVDIYLNWKTEYTQDGLDNIKELGWEELAKKQLRAYGVRLQAVSAAESIENQMTDEQIWRKDQYLENIQDGMSGEVKQFLERIIQQKGKPTLLGEQPFYPRDIVFNHLTKITADATSMGDIVTRMERSKDPVVKDILVALKAKKSPKFMAAFYHDMAVVNSEWVGTKEIITFDENDKPQLRVLVFNANTARAERKISGRWKDNAYNGLYYRQGTKWLQNKKRIAKMGKLLPVINSVTSLGATASVPQEARTALAEYYNLLGVDITLEEINSAIDTGVQINNRELRGAPAYGYLALPDASRGSIGISGIQKLLESEKTPYEEASGTRTLRHLATFKAQFDEVNAFSFINGEGKSIYPINLPTALTRYVRMLQNYDPNTSSNRPRDLFWKQQVENYLFDPSFNPLPGEENADRYRSLFLEATLNSPIFRSTFAYHIYDAHVRLKEQQARLTIKNISKPSDIMIRYNNIINNGKRNILFAFPNLADRQRLAFLEIPRISTRKELHSPVWGGRTVDDILRSYVVQDLMRMRMVNKQLQDPTTDRIDQYHTARRAMTFTQLEFLNDNPAAERLKRFVLTSSDQQVRDLYRDGENVVAKDLKEVMEAVHDNFELEIQEELRRLEELKIDSRRDSRNKFDPRWEEMYKTPEGKRDKHALVKDYVYATFIGQNEIRKMTTGDLAFHPSLRQSAKRSGLIETPGHETMEASMLDDNSYGDVETYNTAIINDIILNRELKGYMEGVPISDELKKQYAQETNVTDGQTITTIHKHRAKMMGRGVWEPMHESAYRNYLKTGVFRTEEEYIIDESGVSVLVEGGIRPPLTPLKTSYDGMHLVNGTTMTRIVDKHSSFPLLKEFTQEYPVLEELRKRMEREDRYSELEPIDEISMDSVRKVGRYGEITLEMKNGIPINLDKLRVVKLNTAFQRTPQIVPDNERPSKFGSQLMKLILTNLKMDGIYKVGDQEITGAELKRMYQEGIVHLLEIQQAQLERKLGYSPGLDYGINPETNEPANDKERLEMLKRTRILLQAAIDDRSLPTNYLEALNIKRDAMGLWNYETPLAHPTLQTKFQNMLFGLWKNKALRLNFNGKSLVQIAELGGHVVSDRLKFIKGEGDQLSVAEVAMSHSALRRMGIDPEDLNNGRIPEEVLTMLSYRIPTSHKANALVIKIARAIPDSMGKAVMVPAEITTQMGSDFDVDKLFLMMPNYDIVDRTTKGQLYNELGSFRKKLAKAGFPEISHREATLIMENDQADYAGEIIQYIDRQVELEAAILKAKHQIRIERKRIGVETVAQKVSYKSPKSNFDTIDITNLNQAQTENLVLDMMMAVMRSKAHAEEILTPVGFDTLKGQAERMGIRKELNSYDINAERQLGLENQAGNAGIGIYANHQTGYAIGQFAPDLRLTDGNELMLDGEKHNRLNTTRTKSGKLLDFAFSERINAATDNAKDPVMFTINDNELTSVVIGLLLRTGAENKRVTDIKGGVWAADPNNLATMFVNQPWIREFSSRYIDNEAYANEMVGIAADVVSDMSNGEIKREDALKYLSSDVVQPITSEQLLEGINHVIEEKDNQLKAGKFRESQLVALATFIRLHRAGRRLNILNKVFNADRISSMSTMAHIEEFNDLDALIRNQTRNTEIAGWEPILNGEAYPPVRKFIDIIQAAQQHGDLFFPYNRNNFTNAKNLLRRQIGQERLQADIINLANTEAFTWLSGARHFPFDGIFSPQVRDEYMNSEDSIDKELMAMKEKYPDNAFLKQLTPSNDNYQDDVPYLGIDFQYNFSLNSFELDTITFGFEELYFSEDLATRRFAVRLIRYMIMSKGFMPGRGNYADLLPVKIWNDPEITMHGESLNSVLEVMLNKYDDITTIGEEFVEDLIKNNYRRLGVQRIAKKAPKNYGPLYINPLSINNARYVQAFHTEQRDWVLYEREDIVDFSEPGDTTRSERFVYVPDTGVPGKWKNYQNKGLEMNNVQNQHNRPKHNGRVTKVISGGQSGADTYGLEVAAELNIPTGGTVPRGYLHEQGKAAGQATAKKFGLKENGGPTDFLKAMNARTEKNIIDSDGTVIFGDIKSPGSKLTYSLAKKHGRPVIVNPTGEKLQKFISDNEIFTLNVAGNRETKLGKAMKERIREALTLGLQGPQQTKLFQKEGTVKASISTIMEINESLEKRFGIDARVIEDHSKQFAGRFIDGAPLYNMAHIQADTPFHEFAHPFVAAIREDNPELWANLVTQVLEEDHILRRTQKLYPELNEIDTYEEAITQLIGAAAAEEYLKPRTRSLIEQFIAWVNKVLGTSFGINGLYDPRFLSADTTIQEIAQEFALGKKKITGKFDIDARSQKLQDKDVQDALIIKDWKTLYNALVKVATQREAIFQRKGFEETAEKFGTLRDALVKGVTEAEQKQAIVHFIEVAHETTSEALERLNKLINNFNSPENATKEQDILTLRKLRSAMDYANTFNVLAEGLNIVRDEKIGDTTAAAVIGNIMSKINRIQEYYKTYGRVFAAEFLHKYTNDKDLKKDEIQRMLTVVSADVSHGARWLGSLSNSEDRVLQLVSKSVKEAHDKVVADMFDFRIKKLAPLEKQLMKETNTSNFDKLYDFMLEKEEGKLTGYYITPERAKEDNIWNTLTTTQKQFLELFHKAYNDAQKLLPESMRRNTQVPMILKSGIEQAVSNVTGVKSGFQEVAKGVKKAVNITIDEEDAVAQYDTDPITKKIVRFLPIRFAGTLESMKEQGFDPKDISYDLGSNLLQFMHMAKNHEAMSKILVELETVTDMVAHRDVALKEGKTFATSKLLGKKLSENLISPAAKKGIESNAYARLVDFMQMQVYGQKKNIEYLGGTNVSLTKAADVLGTYTAVSQLAFNLYSAVNNSTIGNIMNVIEGMGGQFYSLGDWRKAAGDYTTNLPGFVADATKRHPDNVINKWMMSHDLYQEMDEFGEPLKEPNPLKQMGYGTLLFLQSGTEHQIQTQLALAMARSHRVVEGKIMSYMDYIMENNMKKDRASKDMFERNKTVLEYVKEGDLNGGVKRQEMSKFGNRVKALYRRLHGNYSKKDMMALNKFALGRLGSMFRKWIYEGWNRRFQREEYDGKTAFNEELNANIAGNYIIAFNFMQKLKKEYGSFLRGIISFQKSETWKNMPEWRKQGVIRTISEIGFFLGTILTIQLIEALAGDDDDQKSWAMNFGLYQAYRLKAEIAFYTHPGEAIKILRSPMASLTTFEKSVQVLWQAFPESYIPPTWERYEAGPRKGQLKFTGKLEQAMPIWGQVERLFNPGQHVGYMKR